jgi:hypothetical protein
MVFLRAGEKIDLERHQVRKTIAGFDAALIAHPPGKRFKREQAALVPL